MSLPELMFALYGTYEATGVYSFEFRDKNDDNKTITEIFLLLPPGSVSWGEGQFADIVQTIGGVYITDFGNAFKEGKISGETHFYYVGKGKTNIESASNSTTPEDFLDGFSEFLKLRFMLMRYRDYSMTPDAKVYAPDFSALPLASVNALKKWVEEKVSDGDRVLADQIDVIWHDYDRDDHFFVKINTLQMAQDKTDPWTMKYDIDLVAYSIDAGGLVKQSSPDAVKKTAPEQIREIYILSGNEHEETKPDQLPVTSPEGVFHTPANVVVA